MKNITALTFLVIILSAFTVANSAHAQEAAGRDYVFSIGTQFGFIRGQAFEIVHVVPGQTKGEFLSELKWDMKNVYYAGIQMDFGRRNLTSDTGIFSSLSFKAGIPSDSGIMENRDWMSVEDGGLTHFSSHDNRTRQFLMLDAAFGATLPLNSFLYLKPFISGSWMRFAFSGSGGRGTYAREKRIFSDTYHHIDDNPIIISFEGMGNVILYEQNWLLFSPGIAAGTNILFPFTFELSFKMSLFSRCIAKDDHLTKNTAYQDIMRAGFFIEPVFSMFYVIKRIELSLELAYRKNHNARGEAFVNSNNSGFYRAANQSGSGLSFFDCRFAAKFRI